MAGNVSTVDGMGFEEVNQSSYTEMISGNNIYARNMWVSNMAEMNIVSGATFSGDNLRIRLINTTEGPLLPSSIQNATELFGRYVKAGSVLIGDDSSGLISFAPAGSWATPNYFMTISAQNWTIPQASRTGSLASFGVSGIKRASGCWAYGPSGTVADWIAVGI